MIALPMMVNYDDVDDNDDVNCNNSDTMILTSLNWIVTIYQTYFP